MRRAVVILVVAACDAGAPAKQPTPAPPIARPIDAQMIVEMDGPRAAIDIPDAFTATRLAPIAALPADWEHLKSVLRIPALEIGRSGGEYMLIARDHGKIFATTFSPAEAGEITIGSSQGQRIDGRAGLLLVWIDHHRGRHDHAMACAIGASRAWSCSAPIGLEDADLRDDLIFKLGAEHGSLEIPATAQTPTRRYQITFP